MTDTPVILTSKELMDALRLAASELERYVDLQQKLDYIEYAAETQKKLDVVNAALAKAPALETRVLCEHYWGDHARRCQLPSGHEGEHLFLVPGYAIDIDAWGAEKHAHGKVTTPKALPVETLPENKP